MEYTHSTYNGTPEDEMPEMYNPGYQMHPAPSWFDGVDTREGYERACEACGVQPHTDQEISSHAYGLSYAEFASEEWRALYRDTRVLFKIDGLRLKGIERERKAALVAKAAAKMAAQKMVRCDCGHTVPASEAMSASRGTSCPDCYDRMSE
ncbi:MAG: hypothetical protein WC683_12700 [bacterium]